MFGVNSAGQIFHRVQTAPGDWTNSSWQQFPGELATIAVARNADGLLEVFGTNSNNVIVHMRQQSIGVWDPNDAFHDDLGGSLSQIAAETNANGRIEMFGVNPAGQIFHRVQTAPGDWTNSSWQQLNGSLRP